MNSITGRNADVLRDFTLDVTNVTSYRDMMQPEMTSLRDLMDAALKGGRSKAELARLAGCSRMHLWRLYKTEDADNMPSGRRLRAALEGDDLQRVMTQVIDAAKHLAAKDPQRATALRDMLQSVTVLLSKAVP